METYIKGNYRKSIYKSDKGYVIGLFKVRETNIEELDKLLNRSNYVEMTNMIGIAREHFEELPKNMIEKIEKACGVELEIE